MPTTKLSTKGQVVIPHEVRARAGASPGSEYEVETDGRVITLTPKRNYKSRLPLTSLAELLDRRIEWKGPPITDADIKSASAAGAVRRFRKSSDR